MSYLDKIGLSVLPLLIGFNLFDFSLHVFIFFKAYEVIDLFLQKMLYYVKAFSWVRLRKDIIEDDCEAWAYGPVLPEIYEKYKSFGSDVIDDYDESIEYGSLLTDEEIKIIDFVVECFGIYNGSTDYNKDGFSVELYKMKFDNNNKHFQLSKEKIV